VDSVVPHYAKCKRAFRASQLSEHGIRNVEAVHWNLARRNSWKSHRAAGGILSTVARWWSKQVSLPGVLLRQVSAGTRTESTVDWGPVNQPIRDVFDGFWRDW